MSEQNVMDAPSFDPTDDFDNGSAGDYNDGGGGDDDGEGPSAPGTGQSKSSRRRRRKRKNKLDGSAPATSSSENSRGASENSRGSSENGDGGESLAPFVMEGESIALAASAAPSARSRRQSNQNGGGQNAGSNGAQPASQQGSQPQGGQQQNGQQAAGGKRWKKKFRDRERRPGTPGGGGRNENPGNDFRAEASSNNNGGGYGGGQGYRSDNFGNQANGFKRKNKGGSGGGGGGKDRGFVGPMDHSYRASEVGDAAASTIQSNGRRNNHRHHGDNQPIDHNMPRPVPIPEGAQTHIYFFIEELFFVAKIQEAARKLGVKVAFVKNDKDALTNLLDGEENKPALIVVDLNNANAKPLTLIPKLKTRLKRSASIVGFLSHLQGDLKAKAVEAGCDVVMPRAAFSQNLPNLLRRYGVEEEEEVNFNY